MMAFPLATVLAGVESLRDTGHNHDPPAWGTGNSCSFAHKSETTAGEEGRGPSFLKHTWNHEGSTQKVLFLQVNLANVDLKIHGFL